MTLDLADLAGIDRNDRVRLGSLAHRTFALSDRTLEIVGITEAGSVAQ